MNTRHVHADVIKAWADGADIQVYTPSGKWIDCENPFWEPRAKYRVKPKPTVITFWYRIVLTANGHVHAQIAETETAKLALSEWCGVLQDWKEIEEEVRVPM